MTSLIPPAGAIRTWVELYGPMTEAREEAHLGAALATISAAIGWKAWIKWGENAEPCTINVLLQGKSATARKTTTAASAHALVRSAMEGVPEDQQGLRSRTIGHTSNRGLIEQVAPTDSEQANSWEDQPPPGHLLVWDEFGAVLGDPGDLKGQNWLGQVRTTLMQIANGRHGGIQTGGDKLPGARCAVSILGTMTRVELEQRVSSGLLRDGFMGRFILIPNDGRARLLSAPPQWTAPMTQQRDELVKWLRSLSQTTSQLGDVFKHLTPQAAECRQTWYEECITRLERRAEQDGTEESAGVLEAFGRLQTVSLKIAAVHAISEWEPGNPLDSIAIQEHHVQYGQRFAELCLQEIDDLGITGGLTVKDRYAEKVKRFLANHDLVTKKELLDRVRINGLSRAERWRVVEHLHPDDVVIEQSRNGGRPGLNVRATGAAKPPSAALSLHLAAGAKTA